MMSALLRKRRSRGRARSVVSCRMPGMHAPNIDIRAGNCESAPLALGIQELGAGQVGLVGREALSQAVLNCFMQSLRCLPFPRVSCVRIANQAQK